MKSSINFAPRLDYRFILTLILCVFAIGFASASRAQAQGCKVIQTFIADKATPENEALKDMLANTVGTESAQLTRSIQTEFKTTKCIALLVEETSYQDAAVIAMRENVRDEMVSYISNVIHVRMDSAKAGCEDMAKLDVDTRIDRCGVTVSTYFTDETPYLTVEQYGPVTSVSRAKSILEGIFITGKTSALKAALATYGLENQALRVSKSLILMRGTTTAANLVLKAKGYKPELLSDGLWQKRLPVDSQTEKLVATLLFLNDRNQAFLDVNLGGPKIVDLGSFKPPQTGFLMGYDLYESVMNAMAAAGYTYTPGWSVPQPPSPPAPIATP